MCKTNVLFVLLWRHSAIVRMLEWISMRASGVPRHRLFDNRYCLNGPVVLRNYARQFSHNGSRWGAQRTCRNVAGLQGSCHDDWRYLCNAIYAASRPMMHRATAFAWKSVRDSNALIVFRVLIVCEAHTQIDRWICSLCSLCSLLFAYLSTANISGCGFFCNACYL